MACRLVIAPSGRLRFAEPSGLPPADPSSRPRRAGKRRADGGPPTPLAGTRGGPLLSHVLRPGVRCGQPRGVLGQRRIAAAGAAALSDRYLADRRVSARTAANYNSAYRSFVHWATTRHFKVTANTLDRTLRKFLLFLFFDGGAAYDARVVLHGTIFARELPKAATTLPLARATLAGFNSVVPEMARDPMPTEAKDLICADLAANEGPSGFIAAGALATSFDGFFRPSEVLSLESSDLQVLRGRRRVIGLPSVSVLIRPLLPYDAGDAPPQRTKSGEHDETVVFGRSAGTAGGEEWIARFLAALKPKRRGKLFPINLNRYEVLVKKSVGRLQLSALMLTPHSARHGAASTAYATGRLGLRDIQKRGRWKSPASVRVYEKSAKLTRQLARMSTEQLAAARNAATTLPNNLIGRASAL
jgi:hypothetical protein